jgi:serine-type D-Ala-D-Ala carboxypeptidase
MPPEPSGGLEKSSRGNFKLRLCQRTAYFGDNSRPHRPAMRFRFLLLCVSLSACHGAPSPPVTIAQTQFLLSSIALSAQDEIDRGDIHGAVVLIGHHGAIIYRAAFGHGIGMTPLRFDSIFDLASLTKVVATTPAIMQLQQEGRLRLDAPVARYWPDFAANGKGRITIRQLLTHTSGLRPDFVDMNWHGEAGAVAKIVAERPIAPPGSSFIYSDLNFVVLGALVERISGESLTLYSEQHIFAPLRMKDTGFDPSSRADARLVPTDYQQGRLRWGVVQDPTANQMGGAAGHAGLFSTAGDLARFCQMLLNGGELDGLRILNPGSVALMTAPEALPGGITRGLGWDMTSPYSDWTGAAFSTESYGHTGYTGTALWIDPTTDTFLIILTSRLYPDDDGDAMPLRRQVAKAVAAAFLR